MFWFYLCLGMVILAALLLAAGVYIWVYQDAKERGERAWLWVDADGSKINSGQLEMSNVDLSGQFTDMIITQRGFQANSRVITVSDTLLEELINLKR